MRSGWFNTIGIAVLNGGMAMAMYCVGLEIAAIVWGGLAAVVLMGAYWDRSIDRPQLPESPIIGEPRDRTLHRCTCCNQACAQWRGRVVHHAAWHSGSGSPKYRQH